MNKKELSLKREETRKKYKVPRGNNYQKRPLNAIYFRSMNSLRHELMKAQKCHELLKEKKWFITEAENKRNGLIRDVVCLDDGMIYEIETDPRRAERFKTDPESDMIEVIKLWKQKK